jgi:hypothetical protein
MSQYLFPFNQVAEYIGSFKQDVRRESDTLFWSDYDGVTSLKVEPLNRDTSDGLVISEQIVLEHVSDALNKYSVNELAHLNKLSTIGAIFPKNEQQPARIISKASVFSQDKQAVERNYAPIIAGGCALIGWQAALLARGQLEADSDTSPLNGVKDQTQIAENDLESAVEILRKNHLFLNQDGEGLTVEFPWDEGAVSNVFLEPSMRMTAAGENLDLSEDDLDRMAGRTSLLRIKKSFHPYFGNGVSSSLELPLSLEEEGLPLLIDIFNQWEISNPDLPPQFGAWCIGPRAPSFVTFLPNQLCIPGVVQNLTMWGLIRAFRIKEFVKSFSRQ